MAGTEYNYNSWADFKASSDFDPVFWSGIESTASSDVLTVLADLEQTDGRGVAYLLANTSGWSGESGFISALAAYDADNTLALTANAYSPNGTIASIAFYAGYNTSGPWLGTMTSPDGDGNWTIDAAPTSLDGATQVTVEVTDSAGQIVTYTQSLGSLVLGQITGSTGSDGGSTTTYANGTPISLSVANVFALDGGTISSVKFYRDTSGTGIYNPGTVQLLTGTAGTSGSAYTLSGVDTSGWIGSQAIFVVVTESTGGSGVAAPAMPIPPLDPTVIASFYGDPNDPHTWNQPASNSGPNARFLLTGAPPNVPNFDPNIGNNPKCAS